MGPIVLRAIVRTSRQAQPCCEGRDTFHDAQRASSWRPERPPTSPTELAHASHDHEPAGHTNSQHKSFTHLSFSVLLSYHPPIVPSRLLAPRNAWLHTPTHARSPSCRSPTTARARLSASCPGPLANCLRNTSLGVGAMPGALDLHTLPDITSIRKTLLLPVLIQASLTCVCVYDIPNL